MEDAEDLVAEKMERSLTRGKGEWYQTRSHHGCIPTGTHCRVWRSPAGLIGVLIDEHLLRKEDKTKKQLVVDTSKYPGKVYVYEYERQWYFEGIEEPAELRARLEAHEATKKYPRRVPNTFLPF